MGQAEVAAGRFWLGIAMIGLGVYIFLHAAELEYLLHWNHALFSFQGVALTSVMLLIPSAVGIVLVFLDPEGFRQRVLAVLPLLPILYAVVDAVRVRMIELELIEVALSFGLIIGGAALFLSSFGIVHDDR